MSYQRLNPLVRTGNLTNTSSSLATLNFGELYRFGNLVICMARWTNVGSQTGAHVYATIPVGFRPGRSDVFGTYGHTGNMTSENYVIASSDGNLTMAGDMGSVGQVFIDMCWYTNDA